MPLSHLLRQHRERILVLAQRYGATNVRVFGSVARGEDTAASDVDFLVTMARGRTLLDMGGLQTALERLLGRRVDLIADGPMTTKTGRRIQATALPL